MLLLLLVACGHMPTPPAPPVATDSHASTMPPLPPVGPNTMGWTTWSHEQKLAYMKQTVLPAEREIFGRFEPLRFASMTCETCHGQGARDGSYRMPNRDLPHIVGGRGGFQELIDKQPETVRFMQQVVGPETAHIVEVCRARGRGRVRADMFRELNRDARDPARPALDQDPLTRPQIGRASCRERV